MKLCIKCKVKLENDICPECHKLSPTLKNETVTRIETPGKLIFRYMLKTM